MYRSLLILGLAFSLLLSSTHANPAEPVGGAAPVQAVALDIVLLKAVFPAANAAPPAGAPGVEQPPAPAPLPSGSLGKRLAEALHAVDAAGQAGNLAERLQKALATLDTGGRVELVAQVSSVTLANQPIAAQINRRVPKVASTVMTQHGAVNSTTTENLGTILKAIPGVGSAGQIVVELNAETADLGPADEGTVLSVDPQGKETRAPTTETAEMNTTVRLQNGQTVVAADQSQQRVGRTVEYVLLLTARIVAE
jgi:hypothetical protein